MIVSILFQVSDVETFYTQLGCSRDTKVKVVSIFGNTGDGKSFTMNQVFFGGDEVMRSESHSPLVDHQDDTFLMSAHRKPNSC